MPYLITVFISAFLLFLVQPMIAKVLLPYYGGGASVWTACMVFFQTALLLGYAYANALSRVSNLANQFIIHLTLLAFSALFLDFDISFAVQYQQPFWAILAILTKSIGIPFVMLSATGPLIQHWYAKLQNNKAPYYLYAWSNTASLLALLAYPFLLEPLLPLEQQGSFWWLGFVCFMCAMAIVCVKGGRKAKGIKIENDTANSRVSIVQYLLWISLSALGVVFLLSTTNAMTQNISPVPFLWVIPLCLYLLSFIVCFQTTRWYSTWYWFVLLVLASITAIMMYFIGSQFGLIMQLTMYLIVMFIACMVAHAELVNLKPSTENLTQFYLALSFGGVVGSVLVSVAATEVFDQYLEFPLAFVSLLTLLAIKSLLKKLKSWSLVGAYTSGALVTAFVLTYLNLLYQATDVMQTRNFYGVIGVKDVEIDGRWERRLIDGTTSHGTQYLDPKLASIPLSYYRERTGIALLLDAAGKSKESLNVGLIGLGAGTLAAYGRSQDTYHFYELNPAVISAANSYFSYTKDSDAQVHIIQGDGRVSLQKVLDKGIEEPHDILVLDAFSGDSIPQHLLTVEAFELYQKVLSKNGAIAVHISNSHLDLLPLMKGVSEHFDLSLKYFITQGQSAHQHSTEWVWLTSSDKLLNDSYASFFVSSTQHVKDPIIWTDSKSNIFQLLK